MYFFNVEYCNIIKFTYSSNYSKKPLGFSIYTSMRFVIQFYFFQSESFYCFSTQIRVSMLMLNISEEGEFPCLISDLRWEILSILPLGMI